MTLEDGDFIVFGYKLRLEAFTDWGAFADETEKIVARPTRMTPAVTFHEGRRSSCT